MIRKRTLILAYWSVPHIAVGTSLAILGLISLGIIYWSFFSPVSGGLEQQRSDLFQLRRDLSEIESRMSQQDNFGLLTEKISNLRLRLNRPSDESIIVEELAAYSAKSQTRILHSETTLGPERDGLRSVLRDLTVEGSYSQVRSFIGLLSEMKTFTLISKLDLSANPDGSIVRARLRIETLYST